MNRSMLDTERMRPKFRFCAAFRFQTAQKITLRATKAFGVSCAQGWVQKRLFCELLALAVNMRLGCSGFGVDPFGGQNTFREFREQPSEGRWKGGNGNTCASFRRQWAVLKEINAVWTAQNRRHSGSQRATRPSHSNALGPAKPTVA